MSSSIDDEFILDGAEVESGSVHEADEDDDDEELRALEEAAAAQWERTIAASVATIAQVNAAQPSPLSAAGRGAPDAVKPNAGSTPTGSPAAGTTVTPVVKASKGKGAAKGAKGPVQNAVGQKVIDLNRAGHWSKGFGIDVQALTKLKAMPESQALQILSNVEAKASTLQKPSAFIEAQCRRAAQGKPESAETGKATGKGVKRPAPAEVSGPPEKKIASDDDVIQLDEDAEEPAAAPKSAPAPKAAPEPAPAAKTTKVRLAASVNDKLQKLRQQGMQISGAAIRALASADQKDARIVLEAISMRGKVDNPSNFIIASIRKRAEQAASKSVEVDDDEVTMSAPATKAPIAKAPSAKAPIAKSPGPKAPVAKTPAATAEKAPAAKAPVSKTPGAKAPVTKSPGAKAPVAKVPPGGKAPIAKTPGPKPGMAKVEGSGLPPRKREGLDFDYMAVQGKVQALNTTGPWEGLNPIDEAALAALLKIDAHRGLEILEDAEEKGTDIADPSAYVRQRAVEKAKA